jgi:ATP-dependent protease HslVU (ClpYQ) peptidase subunit
MPPETSRQAKKLGSLTNEFFRFLDFNDNSCSTSNRVFDREEEAMSIVAWDGKTLAADRQASYGDTVRTIKKLWKLVNGEVVAVIGTYANCLMVKQWYENGAKQEEWPECQKKEDWAQLIVVKKEGCFYYDSQPLPLEIVDPFCAWGNGRDVAIGAMEMGADAVKAVEIASKHIDGCGQGCDYVMVKQKSFKIVDYDKPLKKCKYVEGW